MPENQLSQIVDSLFQKAFQALESAQSEYQAKRLDFAVNRAYYACFYAASAVMLRRGKQFVKHAGLRSAIHKDLVKSGLLAAKWGKVFDRAFENRQAADYLILVVFEPDQVKQQIQEAQSFVQEMQALLSDSLDR